MLPEAIGRVGAAEITTAARAGVDSSVLAIVGDEPTIKEALAQPWGRSRLVPTALLNASRARGNNAAMFREEGRESLAELGALGDR